MILRTITFSAFSLSLLWLVTAQSTHAPIGCRAYRHTLLLAVWASWHVLIRCLPYCHLWLVTSMRSRHMIGLLHCVLGTPLAVSVRCRHEIGRLLAEEVDDWMVSVVDSLLGRLAPGWRGRGRGQNRWDLVRPTAILLVQPGTDHKIKSAIH